MSTARWDLPENWSWVVLPDVGRIVGGGTPPAGDMTNFSDGGGIPWITPADLTGYASTYIGRGRRDLTAKGFAACGAAKMPAGTVLFSSRAPIGYCVVAANEISTNQGFKSVVPVDGIVPEFLRHYLISSREYVASFASGTTFPEVSGARMAEVAVPVAPTEEQRRIVAKLDALTACTARARIDLDRIPALAARYKQAVLGKVFGELDYEPEKLIDLVDPARGIPYGIVQTGVPVPFGVPTVRCGDVRQFSVEKEGLKIVAQDIADAYARTQLRGGEVLLAIRGSVGNSAVVGPEFAGCNISREVALIPVGKRLRPRFAMFFLGSPEAQAYLKRHVKGVAQTGINLEDVRSLTLPVPELAVQDAVVERIDRALVEIDRLAAEAAAARRLLNRLDQAVLAKAFRGELVPQDPTDEPASILLDRIRAERASAPMATRGRRKAVA
ncbi:MAG: restriction endonuclease subunit S [Caulobacter sp.]